MIISMQMFMYAINLSTYTISTGTWIFHDLGKGSLKGG